MLLQALECDDEESRRLAAATIVKRRGQQSILEIIRRVDSLDDEACKEFSQSPERFKVALELAISKSDDDTRNAAITFIRRTGNFEQFPTLLDQLEAADQSYCETVATAAVEMVAQLSRRLRSNDAAIFPGQGGAALQKYRLAILDELDARTNQFDELSRPETVLRLVLILGGPEDEAVRNILRGVARHVEMPAQRYCQKIRILRCLNCFATSWHIMLRRLPSSRFFEHELTSSSSCIC